MAFTLSSLLALAALAVATPLRGRAVDALDEAATAEAHQRDDGATRAFSDIEIRVRISQLGLWGSLLKLANVTGRRHPTADVFSLTSSRATSEPT